MTGSTLKCCADGSGFSCKPLLTTYSQHSLASQFHHCSGWLWSLVPPGVLYHSSGYRGSGLVAAVYSTIEMKKTEQNKTANFLLHFALLRSHALVNTYNHCQILLESLVLLLSQCKLFNIKLITDKKERKKRVRVKVNYVQALWLRRTRCFIFTLNHHYHHHHYHLSLNHEGRQGTTDNFTTSFLHFPLFSTALWNLVNSRPVHALMLASHLFLSLPCLLPPFTLPFKMVLARPDERDTCPDHCSLHLFMMVRRSSCGQIVRWILAHTSSLVTWSLYEMLSILQ